MGQRDIDESIKIKIKMMIYLIIGGFCFGLAAYLAVSGFLLVAIFFAWITAIGIVQSGRYFWIWVNSPQE
jgi:hypothetical protein